MDISILDPDHMFKTKLIHHIQNSNITLMEFDCIKEFNVFANLLTGYLVFDFNSFTNGLDFIKQIRIKNENLKIIILSDITDIRIIKMCLKFGASGYFLKSEAIETLSKKIINFAEGQNPISPKIASLLIDSFHNVEHNSLMDNLSSREREVVLGITEGLSYKEISEKLFVTTSTIQSHIKNIYRKLNVRSKSELVRASFLAEQ